MYKYVVGMFASGHWQRAKLREICEHVLTKFMIMINPTSRVVVVGRWEERGRGYYKPERSRVVDRPSLESVGIFQFVNITNRPISIALLGIWAEKLYSLKSQGYFRISLRGL